MGDEVIVERRVAPRHELPFKIGIIYPDRRDCGRVRNISASGVWIEHAQIQPEIGSMLRIELELEGASSGLEIEAEVVRYTDEAGGFAARFVGMETRSEHALRVLLAAQALRRSVCKNESNGP